MKKIILFLMSGFSLSSYSAVVTTNEIQRNLAVNRHQLTSIKAQMALIEKRMGESERLHSQRSEEISNTRKKIELIQEQLKYDHDQLKKSYEETRKVLSLYIMNKLNAESEEVESLYEDEAYVAVLKKKLQTLKHQMGSIAGQKIDYDQQLENLKKLEEDEKTLFEVVNNLKQEKQKLQTSFSVSKEKETAMEGELIQKKANKEVSKAFPSVQNAGVAALVEPNSNAVLFKLSPPVGQYTSFQPKGKGINFSFQGQKELISVGSGKVIYSGELASYGKVIMIDHGQDIRTVLLGEYTVRVKKDDTVSRGQIIGHVETAGEQNIYFEVRKKNIAQNALLWLDNLK